MYRRSSAGGSNKIRFYQRIVRENISRVIEDNPELSTAQPLQKPVCAHWKRALDQGRMLRTANVIRAVESVSTELSWMYGYERLPKYMPEEFACAELVGPHGPVISHRLILGLVLYGPGSAYPAHSHDGIAESYFRLSGSVFENDARVDPPGFLIFNPSGRNRRITVAAHESCLLACAWVGSQKSSQGINWCSGVAVPPPPEDLLNHWRRTPTAKVATRHRRVIWVIDLQQQLCVF